MPCGFLAGASPGWGPACSCPHPRPGVAVPDTPGPG